MLKSMTGYGRGIYDFCGSKFIFELKSVNNKFFNLNIKTPLNLKEKEIEIRQFLSKKIERGSVFLSIELEKNNKIDTNNINEEVVKKYYESIKKLSKELNDKETNFLSLALKMPGVFSFEIGELDDDNLSVLNSFIEEIFEKFDNFRIKEGEILEKDIVSRIRKIQELSKEVEKFEKERIEKIKSRINGNLEEFIGIEKIDKNRYEQEIIYYLEQIDFTEEKVRLSKHLDYFLEVIKDGTSGKKLDFVTQEINREINTLGSKAREVNIQQIVVQMKDELEKIKEQLGNIL